MESGTRSEKEIQESRRSKSLVGSSLEKTFSRMDRRSASTREAARERGRISLEAFATGSLGKLLPC